LSFFKFLVQFDNLLFVLLKNTKWIANCNY